MHLGDKESHIPNDILFFPYEKCSPGRWEMVIHVTPAEKHRHYEEGDGKRSFVRDQESVQAFFFLSLSNEKKDDLMEGKMV